jgi:MFS family permease
VTDSSEATETGWLAALRHHDFRLLWSGQAASVIGNQMFPIALAVLALQRGMGEAGLGLVLATQGAALGIGTLLGGSVGDRWRRTRVMIASDALRLAGVLALAAASRVIPTGVLLMVVAVTGFGEGLFQPAYNAVIPRLVPESLLLPANSLGGLSVQTGFLVGPALGGVLAAFGSPSLVFWIDAVTFAASFGTLLAITEPAPAALDAPSTTLAAEPSRALGAVRRAVADFTEGVRAVRERPWMGAVILLSTVIMTLVTAPAYVILPFEAHRHLGGSAAYGAVMAAVGLGAIVGSLVAGKLRIRRTGVVALAGLAMMGPAFAALATLPLAGVIAFWVLAGIGVAIFNVLWMTALQQDVPDHLLGRVISLDMLGSMALMPIGYAITGPLVAALGANTVLLTGAVLVVVTVPLPLLVRGGSRFATPPISRVGTTLDEGVPS